MLGVTSYMELFSLPLAWQQYGVLWQALISTGLVLLPFFRVLLKNVSDLWVSDSMAQSARPILRKTTHELLMMLFVLSIALHPIMPLDQEVLQFTPRYDLEGRAVTARESRTTFDGAIETPRHVKVPWLYYAVMSVSYGLTHALCAHLTPMLDLRQLHAELNASAIDDGALRAEVIDFYNDCWKPCYAKYLKDKPDLQASGAHHTPDDPDWLGSHFFLGTPGFYDTYYAHRPVKNFTSGPIDEGFEEVWSRPHCKAWWTTRHHGLGPRLSKQLPRRFLEHLQQWVQGDQNPVFEKGIRRLLELSFPSGFELMGETHARDRHHFTKHVSAKAGMLWHSIGAYAKLHILISALPVIQALLMVALIISLPLFALLASYRLQVLLSLGAALGAMVFWRYLWELVNLLDNLLIRAFYPTSHLQIGGTNSLGEYVVELVTMFMYVVFPLVLLSMLSWAGWHAGAGLSGYVSQALSPLSGAGDRASALTTGGASRATGRLKYVP